MLLASFFDPNGNGWDITDVAAIFGLIIAIAAVWVLSRKATRSAATWISTQVRDIVRDELETATAPIQPGANGGLSLPDAAKASRRTEQMLQLVAAHLGLELPEYDDTHKKA